MAWRKTDQNAACGCREHENPESAFWHEWHDDPPEKLLKPKPNRAKYVWGVLGCAVVALVVYVASSNSSTAPVAVANPTEVIHYPDPVEAVPQSWPTPMLMPVVESSRSSIEPSAPEVARQIEVLASRPLMFAGTQGSVVMTSFDVGSSRYEVLAAEGSPPTYQMKNKLWWGSSRVTFDKEGRVESWVQGTPALNVRDDFDEQW